MEFDYSLQPGKKLYTDRTKSDAKPLMTVITAFYNAGAYFRQTFYSVMNQTFPWFEWIIVNDGTTRPEDVKLLCELAKTDDRVMLIHQENKGLSYARNVGIKQSCTDIIVPLDADDLIEPQYLEYLFWGLYYNPDASWCYTCSVGFGEKEYLWNYPWDAEKLKTYNFLNYSAAIRKKDIQTIGGYKVEKQSYFEDWRCWLEMLADSKRPVHLGGYLFWYRRLENGMLSEIHKNPEKQKFAEKIIKEAAKHADGTVKAKEYPLVKTKDPYYEPKPCPFSDEYVITNDKIHILMLIPWMMLGGSDRFNLEFVRGISKQTYDISIITTVQSENNWQQKFTRYTDKVFHLPDFLDPAYDLDFVSYYIKTRSVDVVFVTNSYKGYYMLPWLRKQFPHICIIDYVHMEEWYWKAGGYARISGMLGGMLDRTYVCNSVTREVMLQRFGRNADSVKTMYIGVDIKKFDRNAVKPGYLYERLHIPYHKQIVLFPCRMHPQKRPFLMLEIAQNVCRKNKDVLFVAVGDGEQQDELKKAVHDRKLDHAVICIGRVDRMKECYRDAKITLICSLKEGLALTAYESCAMGVPVISSDVGGQKDLIDSTVGRLIPSRQDEVTGIDNRTYDRREIEEFTNAILLLLEDEQLYKTCCKNCRQKAVGEFSVQNMIQKMQTEILELMSDDLLSRRHMHMSEVLKEQGKFAEEFYTAYLTLEEREQECEDVWKAKCYFENRLLCRKKDYGLWLHGIRRKCRQAVKLIYLLFLKVRSGRNKG